MSTKQPTAVPARMLRASQQSQSPALAPARRWLARASDEWLPHVTWSVQRTGRLGLSGMGLLATSVVFLISTHIPLTREVDDLRSQLETAQLRSDVAPAKVGDRGAALLQSLPPRTRMPALLGVLLKQADAAHLSVDTAKYESSVLKSGGVVSYQISFPVTGPYPQVRQFIDGALAALPAVALTELSLTRKSIGDGMVEAQIRLTAFTQDNR